MKNLVMAAMAVLALLAPARSWAETVDFTFTNVSIGDVVTGEIDGLAVGSTGAASSVIITGYTELSAGDPYSFPTPISMTSITNNSFTLDASGALTAADFSGEGFFGSNGTNVDLVINRLLPSEDIGGVFQTIVPNSGPDVQSGGDFGQLDYEPATTSVPEASSSAMLVLALAGLAVAARRRKRKPAMLTAGAVPAP